LVNARQAESIEKVYQASPLGIFDHLTLIFLKNMFISKQRCHFKFEGAYINLFLNVNLKLVSSLEKNN
jgi:hypothetical protein